MPGQSAGEDRSSSYGRAITVVYVGAAVLVATLLVRPEPELAEPIAFATTSATGATTLPPPAAPVTIAASRQPAQPAASTPASAVPAPAPSVGAAAAPEQMTAGAPPALVTGSITPAPTATPPLARRLATSARRSPATTWSPDARAISSARPRAGSAPRKIVAVTAPAARRASSPGLAPSPPVTR